jgi:ankyrin repeat protein
MQTAELIEAAKAGDVEAVRRLLGGDPGLAAARVETGETALMAALYRGHAAVVDLLVETAERAGQPLDVFAAAALGRDAALQAVLSRATVNSYAYDGWTPLHLAAFFGRLAAAERLLVAGADVNAVSRNTLRNTPLHAATAGGAADVALLLIERGADVHAADAGGHTPLHIAAEAGLVPVVKALLARGADPHAVDAEDNTPLSRAAAKNHDAVIDLINVDR